MDKKNKSYYIPPKLSRSVMVGPYSMQNFGFLIVAIALAVTPVIKGNIIAAFPAMFIAVFFFEIEQKTVYKQVYKILRFLFADKTLSLQEDLEVQYENITRNKFRDRKHRK